MALNAKGYTLAQGNRRLVVVDNFGKAINPVRQLADVRVAAFKAKLADLDLSALPTAAAAQKRIKQQQRKEYAVNRKFEKWSAEYQNNNQDRQIEERAKLSARYHKAIELKKTELAGIYKLEERKKVIQELQERVNRPSLFRRISGKAAHDREELAAQKQSYQDSQKRFGEAIGAIETERALATADQMDRHTRENKLARAYLAERKPIFYAEELSLGQTRAGRRVGRNRSDEDGGRERVHYRVWQQMDLQMI